MMIAHACVPGLASILANCSHSILSCAQTAIECCPVSCIHWVERDQLPALEYVMRQLKRTDVGIMAGQVYMKTGLSRPCLARGIGIPEVN